MNLCRTCGLDFASLAAFDKHRVGKHDYLWSPDRPDGRCCLDLDEPDNSGLELDRHGRYRLAADARRHPIRLRCQRLCLSLVGGLVRLCSP
jgi:hypothetical protein